jgi:hypothetical protein
VCVRSRHGGVGGGGGVGDVRDREPEDAALAVLPLQRAVLAAQRHCAQ